jgi:hypothetical protein
MSSVLSSDVSSGLFLRKLVFLLIALIVVISLWITAAAVVENIRFAQATDQILHLIATARDFASTNKNFAAQPGQDLLKELVRAGNGEGVIDGQPAMLKNSWNGYVTATASAPSTMRVETDIASRDCRRMALFFLKNGRDLGLNMMEANQDTPPLWRQFFNQKGMSSSGNQSVEVACGESSHVTLALGFLLN